jgi:hypothetical protein
VNPGPSRRWTAVWRLAVLIAAVRIAALWGGSAAYSRSDWFQIPGYLTLMADLPELYIVRGLRTHPLLWELSASLALAVTSPLWAAWFVWLARRKRRTLA